MGGVAKGMVVGAVVEEIKVVGLGGVGGEGWTGWGKKGAGRVGRGIESCKPVCPSGCMCGYVCLSVCLSVWLCISLSARQKCFADRLDPRLNGTGVPARRREI